MAELPKPFDALTSAEVEGLRTRMRNVLGDTITAAARRVANTDLFPGLDNERARAFAQTRDGKLMRTIIDATAESFIPIIRDLRERLAAVEARPATLADAYERAWTAGSYKRGQVVTHGGSAFLCMKDTEAQPETSTDWVLMVKRGRDGKSR